MDLTAASIVSASITIAASFVPPASPDSLIFIGVVGLGLTELLVWLFAIKLDWHYLLAKIAAVTTVFIWNFSAKKLLLFRNK